MTVGTRTGNGTRNARAAITTLALGLALLLGAPSHAADNKASSGDPELQTRTGRTISLRNMEEQPAADVLLAQAAEQKRMEAIERLKGLLTRAPADETKAEMMLRLADLYFSQGRYLYLGEMADFDKRYEECFNTPNCTPDSIKPNNERSREWQEKSIALYEGILRSYPRYQRADQATFFLGSAQKDIGQEKEASESFKQLVKLYPDSEFVPDAYVQIGEYYFNIEGNAFGALKAYQKASTYVTSSKYTYSMYKLGWCYYNVGEYDKAIDTMKVVVDKSLASDQTNKTSMQLQDEALKDLVRFFADADQMNEAIEYFTKLGRADLIRTTLKRLASMFFEQGKFDRSIEMYRRLILDAPTAKDNPEYQTEIINAYKKMGAREKVIEEINRLRTDYGSESAWARANAANPEAVTDAQSKIEGQLRGIAVDYHNTARQYDRSKHPDAMKVYELARSAYATYLDLFPKNEHTYDVRYAYGELLYRLKDYKSAYDQYMAVVDLDPKGKHSRFCAESAIFSAEEVVKAEGGASGGGSVTAKPTKESQPLPMSEWEQKFVDACNKYATLFASDAKTKDMLYKSAYMLYNKFRFEEAADQFEAVIARDPKSNEAKLGANLILDALAIKENWDSLKSTSKTFFDQAGLGDATFKKDVYEIYMNSSFKLIEVTFQKDQDHGKAADAFVGFYNEFPDSPNAALALNNSAAYYNKSGRVADSMKVRHILVEDPKFGPKTKYYYDQVGFLGYDYELIADYDSAANWYEKVWSLTPAEKKKPEFAKLPDKLAEMDKRAGDAIYSAAVFRKGLGQVDQAITNYNAFVAAFPEDSRVPDIKIRIGKIYEETGRWQDAANVFQAYYKTPPKNSALDYVYFSRLHFGQAMEKLGKLKERDAIYKETVAMYTKAGAPKGPQTEFVAEMMYELAQPALESYMKLRIQGPSGKVPKKTEDKVLVDSLQKKTKALVDVEKTFTAVVETGAGEWGLASLVALGKAYENMGEALVSGDKPSYLTTDQLDIYNMQLQDRKYLQDEKAVNAYKLALDKSYELTLYNENTAYATRQLGVLRPDDYSGLSEILVEPRYTSSKAAQKYPFEPSL